MTDANAPSEDARNANLWRSVATDSSADAPARAAAILQLADDENSDEELTVEPDAPEIVASAVEKAADIRQARRIIADAIAGEAPPATLFDVPALPAPTDSRGVEVSTLPEGEHRDLREILQRRSALVTHELAGVPIVTCDRRAWAILLDPASLDPERLRTSPARPASVATRDVLDQTQWRISLEVVTAIREGTIAIAAIDRRGRTRYVGSATPVDEAAIEFSVRSADRPDSRPTSVRGMLRAGRLELLRVERGHGATHRIPLIPQQSEPTAPSRQHEERPEGPVSDEE